MHINLNEIISNNLLRNGISSQHFIKQLGVSNHEYQSLIEENYIESQTLLYLSQYFRKDLTQSYSQLYFNRKKIITQNYNKNEYTKIEITKKYFSNIFSIDDIRNILCISPKILDFYINKDEEEVPIEKRFHIGKVIKLFCLNSGWSLIELSEIMKKNIKNILLDFNKKSIRYEEVLKWSLVLNINLFEVLSLHYESLGITNHRYKIKIKEIC